MANKLVDFRQPSLKQNKKQGDALIAQANLANKAFQLNSTVTPGQPTVMNETIPGSNANKMLLNDQKAMAGSPALPPGMVAPNTPSQVPDLSKITAGNTTEMSNQFKDKFGRAPSANEMNQLVQNRALAAGTAGPQAGTGLFNPAQDIATTATNMSNLNTPTPSAPTQEKFSVSDETITSDDLASTDAVSRLNNLKQVESKFFEDQTKIDKQIVDIDTEINKFKQGYQAGLDLISDQAIPMGFIVGQQESLERRANRQLQTLADLKGIAVKQQELAQSNLDYRMKFATASRLEEEFQMSKDKFQQEQQLGRLELIAKAGGTLRDGDILALDTKYGDGFAEKYMETFKEAADLKESSDKVKIASDIMDIRSKVPSGIPLNIGGVEYSGIKEIDPDKGLHVMTATADDGTVTQVTTKYNSGTGKMEVVNTLNLGRIGNKQGSGTGTDFTKLKSEITKTASDLIEKLDTGKIPWQTAFDSIQRQYGTVLTNDEINGLLGGGIPYDTKTSSFDTSKAFGRAIKKD